jgi:hypothetical protein
LNATALVQYVQGWARENPAATKEQLAAAVAARFSLQKERSLWVCRDFAVRFCRSSTDGVFCGGVLAIGVIARHDDDPLVVCLQTPAGCAFFLANLSFVDKVSHSSQALATGNLRGTILGSNILKRYGGIDNEPGNFDRLWSLHRLNDRAENLKRIIDATHDIVPTAGPWPATEAGVRAVCHSATIAASLSGDPGYADLSTQLDRVVASKHSEILAAAAIDNVKDRGERIETLVTGGHGAHTVGDLACQVGTVCVLVDVKSKLTAKSSAPKGWNIDKVLSELSKGDRVVSMYFVRIDLSAGAIQTRLVSICDTTLIAASAVQPHWSGRATRGTIQYLNAVDNIWTESFHEHVDVAQAVRFLTNLIGVFGETVPMTRRRG